MKSIACIYRPKTPLDLTQASHLKINQNNIVFLQSALLATCEFILLKDQRWLLIFFKENQRFKQQLLVDFIDYPENSTNITTTEFEKYLKNQALNWQDADLISRAAFISCHNHPPNEEETALASLGVRNTRAIQKTALHESTTHFSHIDGRGLMFLNLMGQDNQHFQRHIILMALAHAYLMAMEVMSNELANAVGAHSDQTESALRALYLDIAGFNARYVFYRPVKSQNTGLAAAWQRIDHALGVSQTNSELSKQINAAHYILNLDTDKKLAQQEKQQLAWQQQERAAREAAEKREEKRDKNRNYILVFIGLFISLAGLFSDAFNHWLFSR